VAYPEFLRLPPFPLARLAAALCPDWRRPAAPAEEPAQLASPDPRSRSAALLNSNPSAEVTPEVVAVVPAAAAAAAAVAVAAAAAVAAVGAEWLAAQPGDGELASECLLRDVHAALLRVIDGDDVAPAPPPNHSRAEGGGGAEPLG